MGRGTEQRALRNSELPAAGGRINRRGFLAGALATLGAMSVGRGSGAQSLPGLPTTPDHPGTTLGRPVLSISTVMLKTGEERYVVNGSGFSAGEVYLHVWNKAGPIAKVFAGGSTVAGPSFSALTTVPVCASGTRNYLITATDLATGRSSNTAIFQGCS